MRIIGGNDQGNEDDNEDDGHEEDDNGEGNDMITKMTVMKRMIMVRVMI